MASQNEQKQQSQHHNRNSGSVGFGGHGRGGRRKQPKRNADPVGFEEWAKTDQEFYEYVTKVLRNWRATERQCSAIRRPITFFENIKLKCKSNRQVYNLELEAHRQTLLDYVPIPDDENFDLP